MVDAAALEVEAEAAQPGGQALRHRASAGHPDWVLQVAALKHVAVSGTFAWPKALGTIETHFRKEAETSEKGEQRQREEMESANRIERVSASLHSFLLLSYSFFFLSGMRRCRVA